MVNIDWSVDKYEILVFITIFAILSIVITMLHYNSVQQKITKNSRCYIAKNKSGNNGSYSVDALNINNKKLYSVIYDLNSKNFNLNCSCQPGDVVNKFYNIQVYDLKSKKPAIIDEKICQCDSYLLNIKNGENVYYSGDPQLVNFMNTGDTIFFDQNL